VFTGLGPTRHDRPVVPPARHGPYKNNCAGPELRGPARYDTKPCRAWTGAPRAGPARPVGHV
jgi:hypothetical protein